MTQRHNPGFLLGEKIPAQALFDGSVSRADLTPGTGIESIGADDVFDGLVVCLARIILYESGMKVSQISAATWPLYEPRARKPTIASRFAANEDGQEQTSVSRVMVIVPPYTPPISSDSGYVHANTLSAWAVKSSSETDPDNRKLFTAVCCTLYQPKRSGMKKELSRAQVFAGEDNLLARFQSFRKVMAVKQ